MLAVLGALALAPQARAQDSLAPAPTPDARRATATRAELQAALQEAEKIVASPGHSESLRERKRLEAQLIRERLENGDFQVGDQLQIMVEGEQGMTGTFVVNPDRTISITALPDISLKGVLRSEAPQYLTQQIGRFVKDPKVRVKTLIRLSLMGGIPKQGFYQLDADMLLSDALMSAGGVGAGTDLKKSVVVRGDEEIVSEETFASALSEGLTLDQLNLRAGDEIQVGIKKKTDWFKTLRTVAVIPALILSTYGAGRLLGIF